MAKQRYGGDVFLELTQEYLTRLGIVQGPVKSIMKLISKLNIKQLEGTVLIFRQDCNAYIALLPPKITLFLSIFNFSVSLCNSLRRAGSFHGSPQRYTILRVVGISIPQPRNSSIPPFTYTSEPMFSVCFFLHRISTIEVSCHNHSTTSACGN